MPHFIRDFEPHPRRMATDPVAPVLDPSPAPAAEPVEGSAPSAPVGTLASSEAETPAEAPGVAEDEIIAEVPLAFL